MIEIGVYEEMGHEIQLIEFLEKFLFICTNKGFVWKINISTLEIELDKKIGKNENIVQMNKIQEID